MATMTFDDEFNSLNLWDGSGGTWQPSFSWSPNGYQGNQTSSWVVNPSWGPTSGGNVDPYSVANGVLSLGLIPTPPSVLPSVNNAPFLTGQLETQQSFSQTYGYFEMNAKLPSTPGLISAFWLLPEDNSRPPEIDVAEVISRDPGTLVNTVTTNDGSPDNVINTWSDQANTSTGFHTFAVDWEPDNIIWYFDGVQTFQQPTPSDAHKPMYMVADTYAGTSDSWQGMPAAGATGAMQINYIRVYTSNPYTSGGAATAPTPAPTLTPAPTPTPTPAPAPTTGAGSDTLVLNISEDAYQGDAQFTVSVDGQEQGGTLVATTLHASGSSQSFTLNGNWGPGSHTVTVNFLNDAYGGSAATDRNLYVNDISYDGVDSGQNAALWGDGPQSFTIQGGTGQSGGGSAAGAVAGPTLAIAPSQSRVNVAISNGTITATSGDHMVFISGSGNTFDLTGGTATFTDSGSGGNTFALPTAGKGSYVFDATVLNHGDKFDLTASLAATSWDGSANSLTSYLHTLQSGGNTELLITSTAQTQATDAVLATFDSQTLDLSQILARSIT